MVLVVSSRPDETLDAPVASLSTPSPTCSRGTVASLLRSVKGGDGSLQLVRRHADQRRSCRRRDAEDLQHRCVLTLRENILWPADASPQGDLWAPTDAARSRWRVALVSSKGSTAGPRKPGTEQDHIVDALVHGSVSHVRGGVAATAAQLTRVFRSKNKVE